jgi:hypothetical protein
VLRLGLATPDEVLAAVHQESQGVHISPGCTRLTSQYFEGLQPGVSIGALVLSPQGHVEHAM